MKLLKLFFVGLVFSMSLFGENFDVALELLRAKTADKVIQRTNSIYEYANKYLLETKDTNLSNQKLKDRYHISNSAFKNTLGKDFKTVYEKDKSISKIVFYDVFPNVSAFVKKMIKNSTILNPNAKLDDTNPSDLKLVYILPLKTQNFLNNKEAKPFTVNKNSSDTIIVDSIEELSKISPIPEEGTIAYVKQDEVLQAYVKTKNGWAKEVTTSTNKLNTASECNTNTLGALKYSKEKGCMQFCAFNNSNPTWKCMGEGGKTLIAKDDSYKELDALVTYKNTPLTIDPSILFANDSDKDGSKLTIVKVEATSDTHGKVELVNNHAMKFDGNSDGKDDKVTYMKKYEAIQIKNNFSFGAWIKANDKHEIDPESLSKGRYSGVSGQNYAFDPLWGSDRPDLHQENGLAGAGLSVGTNGISVYEHGGHYMPAAAVYKNDIGTTFHHIMVVYKDKTPYIYLDGKLVRKGVKSPAGNVYVPSSFGGMNYGDLNGIMDEIQIYNRPLNSFEIKLASKRILPKNGLIVYIDMEGDNLSKRLFDKSFHGHNGILYGDAKIVEIGKLIKFTPDKDYIGQASFKYIYKNEKGQTATATVTINIKDKKIVQTDHAIKLDGVDDFLDAGVKENILAGKSHVKIVANVRLDSMGRVYKGPSIIDQWDWSAGRGYRNWFFGFLKTSENSTGQLIWIEDGFIFDGYSVSVDYPYTNDGKFHKVEVEKDGKTIKLSIDGKLVKTGTVGSSTIQTGQSEHLLIGAYENGSWGRLKGSISDIKITSDGKEIVHYDFEGETPYKDKSGNGYDMQPKNNPKIIEVTKK